MIRGDFQASAWLDLQRLHQSRLKWLLPQTAVEFDGLFLYYPRRASLAPKLRAFIDVAKKTLKSFQ